MCHKWQTSEYKLAFLICLRIEFAGDVSSINVDSCLAGRNLLAIGLFYVDMTAKFPSLAYDS